MQDSFAPTTFPHFPTWFSLQWESWVAQKKMVLNRSSFLISIKESPIESFCSRLIFSWEGDAARREFLLESWTRYLVWRGPCESQSSTGSAQTAGYLPNRQFRYCIHFSSSFNIYVLSKCLLCPRWYSKCLLFIPEQDKCGVLCLESGHSGGKIKKNKLKRN